MDATVIETPVPHFSQNQSNKKGFTLTEIAIVLGIIGLILGAVWSAASGVYANQKSSAFTQNMTLYIAAIRGACNGSCSSVPTVTQAIPTVANSGATVVATPVTSGTYAGGVQLAYTGIANTTSAGIALCNGLSSAATATGSAISLNASGITPPTPSCSNYTSTNTTPTCTSPNPAIYTSGYVSGGATNACASTTTVVTGTCSLGLVAGQCAPQLYFQFSPSF